MIKQIYEFLTVHPILALVVAGIIIPMWYKLGLLDWVLRQVGYTGRGGGGMTKQDLADNRVEEVKKSLEQLADTANHNFTSFNETFRQHSIEDAKEFGRNEEFRQEVRDFIKEQRLK